MKSLIQAPPQIIIAQLNGLEQPTHAGSNGALPAVNTRECTPLRSVFNSLKFSKLPEAFAVSVLGHHLIREKE